MTAAELIRFHEGDAWHALKSPVPSFPKCIGGEMPSGIVVHIRHFGLGGLERVVREQCRVFVSMGMKVCLAVSGEIPESHYPLPDGVCLRRIPSGEQRTVEAISGHVTCLLTLLREFSAEVYLDSTYYDLVESRSVALWDLIAVRMFSSARSIVHWHTSFSRFLREPRETRFATGIGKIAGICDGLIALSRVDRRFFASIGFRAFHLPNPVDPELLAAERMPIVHGPTLLWCGRISVEKRPLMALRIFAAVRKRCPELRFTVVGGGDKRLLDEMRSCAAAEGVLPAVDFVGMTQEPYSHYRRADLLINTSEREGYPMTFVESAAFGVPVVSVGKRYLELLRDGRLGFVADDEDAAVEWIGRFFNEDEFRRHVAASASGFWRELAGFDLASAYAELFRDLAAGGAVHGEGDDFALLVDEFLAAANRGFEGRENVWKDALPGRAGMAAVKMLREYCRIFRPRSIESVNVAVRKLRGDG